MSKQIDLEEMIDEIELIDKCPKCGGIEIRNYSGESFECWTCYHLWKMPKQELKPYLDKAKMQIDKVRKLGMQLQVTGTPTVFLENGERTHGGFTADELIASFAGQ